MPQITKTYRGGWNTSITGSFHDPSSRSDCCALACCGLLLSDRNYYLALQETPPPWWKRFGLSIGLPVLLLTALVLASAILATDETKQYWQLTQGLTLTTVILLLLCKAKYERIQVRRAIMTQRHAQRYAYGSMNTPTTTATTTTLNHDTDPNSSTILGPHSPATPHEPIDTYLQRHRHDIRAAHSLCSCWPKDELLTNRNNTQSDHDNDNQNDITEGTITQRITLQQEPPSDLCRCLWNTLTSTCCGYLCGVWWLCCGLCAISQEDRELRLLLNKKDLQVDYITFQPYSDYFGKLQELRLNQVTSLWLHFQSISQLSTKLLTMLFITILWLTLVALLKIDPQFNLRNLAVVIATFSQAFLIIYFVHWNRHRLDLSLDAVIKYFSSGFILCTFLAIVYEMLVASILNIVAYTVIFLGIVDDITPDMTHENINDLAKQYAKDHLAVCAIFVFFNAFVVAGLVEELSKYFGFWMVEHPDMMDTKDIVPAEGSETPTIPNRTLISRGSATTIAMVAVAAGFACSENLLYVFVYTPPNITNEVATLVARSLFPVHPLCAAIQSIGVVQRDLEGNSKCQLGRIVFPAILLHGAFDFVLMLMALIQAAKHPAANSSGGEKSDDADDVLLDLNTASDLIPIAVSVGLVLVGCIYYCAAAGSQRKRLRELECSHEGDVEETLV